MEPLEWGAAPGPVEGGPFDLVLGSDLIYSQSVVAPLLRSVAANLKRGARMLLAGSFALSEETWAEVHAVGAALGLVVEGVGGQVEFAEGSSHWLKRLSWKPDG